MRACVRACVRACECVRACVCMCVLLCVLAVLLVFLTACSFVLLFVCFQLFLPFCFFNGFKEYLALYIFYLLRERSIQHLSWLIFFYLSLHDLRES